MPKLTAEEQTLTENTTARPFIKWVGGKRSILPELTARMPVTYGTYHEVFLGGGALFFAVQPERSYLSDVNLPLILTYTAVRDQLEGLVAKLVDHSTSHDKEHFLQSRKQFGQEKDLTTVAALFIYLNKTCYNGLYRVNKSGGFNVPMGSYKNPAILDEPNLRLASAALQLATIKQHSFADVPVEGDGFYYFDPPYHCTFDGYDKDRFGDAEHQGLADLCRKLNRAGARFMVSNSDTPFVRSLYKGFHIEQVQASRSVSCKGDQRGKETEVIIRNYE